MEMSIKQVNMAEWTLCGEGGRGRAYSNPDMPGKLLKMNVAIGGLEWTENDFRLSRRVHEMGISSPEVYELVCDGEGRYGMIVENLPEKISFARLVANDPSRLDDVAHRFAGETKKLHSTSCDTSLFEPMATRFEHAIQGAGCLSERVKDKLCAILGCIEPGNSCLHGDLHFGNMVQCSRGDVWIDLGEFGYGNPLVDLTQMYMLANRMGEERSQRDFHMSAALLLEFYKRFEHYMYGDLSDAALADLHRRFDMISLVRYGYYCGVDPNTAKFLAPALEKMV